MSQVRDFWGEELPWILPIFKEPGQSLDPLLVSVYTFIRPEGPSPCGTDSPHGEEGGITASFLYACTAPTSRHKKRQIAPE